jgi:hypothetical protein
VEQAVNLLICRKKKLIKRGYGPWSYFNEIHNDTFSSGGY